MRFALILTVLAAAVLLPAAGIVSESADTVRYREVSGREVTLHKNPKRVIATFGSLADPWYAAGGTLVGLPGVNSKDTLPEGARSLPAIGGSSSPNSEKILLLAPELVLLNDRLASNRAVRPLLEKAGVETVSLYYASYEDFTGLLELFHRLNGTSLENMQSFKRKIDAIVSHVKGKPSPKVAILFVTGNGFSLESASTNTGLMVRMLGAENIAGDSGADRIKFSFERLLMEDPDVLLVSTMGDTPALQQKFTRELTSLTAWRELKAAKENRVHFLPPALFLYMAGTRYPEAFAHLAGLLYPEVEFK